MTWPANALMLEPCVEPARTSATLPLRGGGIMVHVLPPCCRWSLRANASEVATISEAWGSPLPGAILTSISAGDRHALSVGPDEWLLLAGRRQAGDTIARRPPAAPFSLVDVSHRNVAIEVTGPSGAIALN